MSMYSKVTRIRFTCDSGVEDALQSWLQELNLEDAMLGSDADYEYSLDKNEVLEKVSGKYLQNHILPLMEECDDCNKAKYHTGEENYIDLGFQSDYHKDLNEIFQNAPMGNLKYVKPSGRFWYPPRGYMGWHNNNDHEGWRLYSNWSEEGHKSFFRYRNPLTEEIVTDWDKKGWNHRLFYCTEKLPLWHCVYSDTNRISVGFWYETVPTEVTNN